MRTVIVPTFAFGVGGDLAISSHAYRFRVGSCRAGEQPKRTVPRSPYCIPEQPSFTSPAHGLRVRTWVCGEPPTKTPRESPYRTPSQPFESPAATAPAKSRAEPVRKSVERWLRIGDAAAAVSRFAQLPDFSSLATTHAPELSALALELPRRCRDGARS